MEAPLAPTPFRRSPRTHVGPTGSREHLRIPKLRCADDVQTSTQWYDVEMELDPNTPAMSDTETPAASAVATETTNSDLTIASGPVARALLVPPLSGQRGSVIDVQCRDIGRAAPNHHNKDCDDYESERDR
jgi:hypothetical protein